MKIVLKNEYGSFEIGGGNHPVASLRAKSGFGIVGKEAETITFAGQPGKVTTNIRDVERIITLSIDFYGDPDAVEKLYRIIQYPVKIMCFFGSKRKQIEGRVLESTEIENIIYHKWQSIVLQFVCDNPYFNDFTNNVVDIATPIPMLPNLNEDGEWFISLPAVATSIDKTSIINNRSDVIVYPTIMLYSHKEADDTPESYGLIIKNITTNATIRLNYNLSVNEEITIDLPGRKIKSNINGNITGTISDDTVLGEFYLIVGRNEIAIESLNRLDNVSGKVKYSNNYISAVI